MDDYDVPNSAYEQKNYVVGDDEYYRKLLGKSYKSCYICAFMDTVSNLYTDKEDRIICRSCIEKLLKTKES